jgi:hypothetical protein
MKQSEQVIKVMENNGGYATLGYLYQNVNVKDWNTKTPFASIRRIVQNSRFFFKIRAGLWALNDHRDKVLGKFNLKTGEQERENAFNHTYYQGLIVEIGNLKNFKTHIPNQDKNKLFLEKPLKKVSSLEDIYEFSYPNIVQRANTIDVIWFNNRKLPYAFFEVEYSTDFQNSLGKYADLQDFNTKFILASPIEKKRKFEDIINIDIFREIKNRVQFVDFDYISALHTKTIEIAELQKVIKL